MALAISLSNLRSSDIAKATIQIGVIKVKCDSNYPTGGYPLDLTNYFDFYIDDYHIQDNCGFSAAWDRQTKRLLVSRGGSEVGAGTDLSNVEFCIQAFRYGGFKPPRLDQTSEIQSTTAMPYIKKNQDDIITAGETKWSSGATLSVATGGSFKLEGELRTAEATEIASDNQNVTGKAYLIITDSTPDTITNFTGTSGQVLKIITYLTSRKIIKHEAGKIETKTGQDIIVVNGDSFEFRKDPTTGAWKQQGTVKADGSDVVKSGGHVVYDIGSVQTLKGAIREETVEITSNGQDLTTTSFAKITTNTPSTISTIGGTPVNGQKLKITSTVARTIQDAQNAGGISNIVLPGNVDVILDENDYIELVYDESSGKWIGHPVFIP